MMAQLSRSICYLAVFVVPICSSALYSQCDPASKLEEESARHRALILESIALQDRLRSLPDLPRDVSPDRPLGAEERAVLLDAIDYVIDERKDWADRTGVMQFLGARGHEIAIPALLAILRNERERLGLRKDAAYQLSLIPDPRVVHYLIEDGLSSSEPEIAIVAVAGLSQLVGRPPELYDKGYSYSTVFPPGSVKGETPDPEELEEYLDVWRQWWKQNKDKIELHRSGHYRVN